MTGWTLTDSTGSVLPVVEATLSHPATGAWTAQTWLAADAAPSGLVTLTMGGLSLRGTVRAAAAFGGRVRARLQGGQGHLGTPVPGQHFRDAPGRLIAQALCASVGETLDPASDAPGLSTILPNWNYFGSPFARAIGELAAELECSWWVTPAGLVRLGVLSWPTATPDVVVQDERGDQQSLHLALTSEVLVPGVSFQGQQIAAVDHTLTAAAWRAVARVGEEEHPQDAAQRAMVEHFQQRVIPPLQAIVTAMNGDGTVDLRLDLSKAARQLWELDAGLQGVPLVLQGCWQVQLAPGARVVLEFLASDRKTPVVRSIVSGTLVKVTLAAPTVDLGGMGATIKLAGGTKPVIRAADVPAGLVAPPAGGPVTGAYGASGPPGTVLA